MIIEEYFLNGFNKLRAFEKFRNNYKTRNSLINANCLFWQREEIKQEVNKRLDLIIGEREELINQLLYSLKERVFLKEIDDNYSFSNKQKDIELLIKVSGIDKTPKYQPQQENMTVDVVIIEGAEELED